MVLAVTLYTSLCNQYYQIYSSSASNEMVLASNSNANAIIYVMLCNASVKIWRNKIM